MELNNIAFIVVLVGMLLVIFLQLLDNHLNSKKSKTSTAYHIMYGKPTKSITKNLKNIENIMEKREYTKEEVQNFIDKGSGDIVVDNNFKLSLGDYVQTTDSLYNALTRLKGNNNNSRIGCYYFVTGREIKHNIYYTELYNPITGDYCIRHDNIEILVKPFSDYKNKHYAKDGSELIVGERYLHGDTLVYYIGFKSGNYYYELLDPAKGIKNVTIPMKYKSKASNTYWILYNEPGSIYKPKITFEEDTVYHAETEEEANMLLREAHEQGFKWSSYTSLIEENNWGEYENLAYWVTKGEYGSIEFYKRQNKTIIKVSDLFNLKKPVIKTYSGDIIPKDPKPVIRKRPKLIILK